MGLFEAVRDACGTAAWSRGGELARRGAVRGGEAGGPGEAVLRVVEPGRIVAARVVLSEADEEWECDCGSRDDPCAHVAAAAIALRQKLVGEVEARLAYRFVRENGALSFERVAKTTQGEEPFRGTLAGRARGAGAGPEVTASELDFEVERLLGAQRAGRLPRGVLHKLVAALEASGDVRLDGEPIHPRAAPCEWRVRVVDDGPGFRLALDRHPTVSEKLGEDVVRCGDELRVLGASGLEGRDLEALSRGRKFAPEEAAELAAEVIPALEKKLHVEVETRRLPEARSEPPRLVVETSRAGDALSVFATLVYGDPPRARIDAGRLVPLAGALPLRVEVAEQRLAAHLRSALGLEPGVRREMAPSEALRFTARLEAFRGTVQGRAHQDYFLAGTLAPRFAGGRDDLALEFRTGEGAGENVDAARAVRAWRAGESLVPLAGGGFAELPADWLARHGPLVADLLAAREAAGGALAKASLPDLARLCEALGAPDPPSFAKLRPLVSGFAGVPRAQLPADVRAELRDYQRTGVDWLRFLGEAGLGALLADDMGLGKTLQALCALPDRSATASRSGPGRTLVVAPTSVLFNWWDECGRFRPALRRCLFHGPSRVLDPDADVTFTSYALLRLDRERLAAEAWDAVVLDEAQSIKNPDSQAAQAAFALRAPVRMALSGTPIENRLDELWSLFRFLNPGLLGERRDFDASSARPIAGGDADAAERLRRRIRPFLLRRRKSEVARELPPRQEITVRVALSESER
ncbi:MAG TPA: SNF2-related protein, partial [Myxococcota bacterium]|nr:SNF2-related protein [Myxococcota bacterium]